MEGAAAPNEKLEEARQQMQALAVQAGQVQRDCGLDIVPTDFCKETLKFGLLEARHLPLEQQRLLLATTPGFFYLHKAVHHPSLAVSASIQYSQPYTSL